MVTIAEDCPASWWRQRSDSEDTEDTQDTSKTSAASSQARLVQCELVQIQSPSVTPARGYQGAFHQITRYTLQMTKFQSNLCEDFTILRSQLRHHLLGAFSMIVKSWQSFV